MRLVCVLILIALASCSASLPDTDAALANQIAQIGSLVQSNLSGTATPSSQQGAYVLAPVGSTTVVMPVGTYGLLSVLVTEPSGAPAQGVVVSFQSAPNTVDIPWGLGTTSSGPDGVASVQCAPRSTTAVTVIATVLYPAASNSIDFLVEGQ